MNTCCLEPVALFLSPEPASCVTQRKGEIILTSGRGISFSFFLLFHTLDIISTAHAEAISHIFMSSNMPELRSNSQVTSIYLAQNPLFELKELNWMISVLFCFVLFSEFYKMK